MESHPQLVTMQSFGEPLDENALQDLYGWVDQIPLSRPKKNFARDFADAGNTKFYIQLIVYLLLLVKFPIGEKF